MHKSIVVIGSSNTDMIVKASRIPHPGETVLGGKFTVAAGGKGANQAVAAARAGGKVTFIARVGDDMFGERSIIEFARDGIDIEHIIRDPEAPSGVALITVDEKGENSITVAPGCNARLSPRDIEKAEKVISSARILLVQLEIPFETVEKAVEIAFAHNVDVLLNPAPAQPMDDAFLKKVSLITPNKNEAELLTGIRVDDELSAAKAAGILRNRGIKSVFITLGAQGVYTSSPEFRGIIPAFPVKAEDTTAAGDVFNGVLAVSLSKGECLLDAVRFASAAAAISVTRMGAQTSAPYRAEIEEFLKMQG
ncbi:MAG: ribokinase [Candidatus Latescibacterota bacterium]